MDSRPIMWSDGDAGSSGRHGHDDTMLGSFHNNLPRGILQTLASCNPEVFREPRGFLRLLQFLLVIFAMGTCIGGGSEMRVNIACGGGAPAYNLSICYHYPYDMSKVTVPADPCHNFSAVKEHPLGDSYSSHAHFFIFCTTIAFMSVTALLIIYVYLPTRYHSADTYPRLDLFLTLFVAALWLLATLVWTVAVPGIRATVTVENVKKLVMACDDYNRLCEYVQMARLGTLNVSVLFAWLNTGVWCATVWFIFKECAWFHQWFPLAADGGGRAQLVTGRPPSARQNVA